jgi:uncharacterized hydrophobic protein (TIGR00341 family)
MQIVHATFEPGEGQEAVKTLDNLGVDIEDYKLIESDSGDLLIINLLYGQVDQLLDRLKAKFNFSKNKDRSLIIFSPDTVIPFNKEKREEYQFRATRETIVSYVKSSSQVDSKFMVLSLMASIIVTMGLILNNTPVIVGAMVIAPVFGPISAMAVGIVLGKSKIFIEGLLAEGVVITTAITIGGIFGLIIPNVAITDALLVRMYPTIADLLVALAAGGAGAYSLITGIRSQQLVGVVIAAALIPVMSAIGIGIALGNLTLVIGTSLLLLGNLFALLLAIIITFYLKGLKPQWWYRHTAYRLIKKSLVVLTISVIVLALPLSLITYNQFIREKPEDEIRSVYKEYFEDQLETRLISIDVDKEKKQARVAFYFPEDKKKDEVKKLARQARQQLDGEYEVKFELVPIEFLQEDS